MKQKKKSFKISIPIVHTENNPTQEEIIKQFKDKVKEIYNVECGEIDFNDIENFRNTHIYTYVDLIPDPSSLHSRMEQFIEDGMKFGNKEILAVHGWDSEHSWKEDYLNILSLLDTPESRKAKREQEEWDFVKYYFKKKIKSLVKF